MTSPNRSPFNNVPRIYTELKHISELNDPHISVSLIDNNLCRWNVKIIGYPGTLYENKELHLKITLSKDYPFKPPKVKFTTPVYHPNIYEGSVCLGMLKKGNWLPITSQLSIIMSIIHLLEEPNPDDPFDVEATKMYVEDKTKYTKIVRKN